MILFFILDGIILRYAPYSLFSILLFIFVSKKNIKKYYGLSFIIGLLYDFLYSNTLFYNSFIFLSCAFLIKKLQEKFSYNLFNTLIIAIITIIYYYSLSFIILTIIKYISFDFTRYFNIVINSIILNTIFIVVLYLFKRKKHIY